MDNPNNDMQLKQSHATLPVRYGSADDPRHPDTNQPICAVKSKHPNKFGDFICLGPVVAGRKRCRMHGGRQPRGMASPHTKTGRYSKDLPTRLVARYEEALNDPELLDLSSEMALLGTRLSELLSKIDTGEAKSLWERLREAKKEMVAARDTGDAAGLAYWLNEVISLIDKGASDAARWNEIYNVADKYRKLADTERKRRVDMKNYVTVEQQFLFVKALSSLVNQYVTDPKALAAISDGMMEILADNSHAQAEA